MNIVVFAKKRNTKEGKIFYTYLSKLTKKDGTEVTCAVKFRDECGAPRPEVCPCNLIIEKGDCNFSSKASVNDETGEILTSNTLWVNKWEMGDPYVDHSMDEFI